jgi:hypothetical protein
MTKETLLAALKIIYIGVPQKAINLTLGFKTSILAMHSLAIKILRIELD